MKTSIIHHDIRNEFDLNFGEYCVIDFIDTEKNVTRSELAVQLGCSRPLVIDAVKVLLAKGLITKTPDRKAILSTTDLWKNAIAKKNFPIKEVVLPKNTPTFEPWHPVQPFVSSKFKRPA